MKVGPSSSKAILSRSGMATGSWISFWNSEQSIYVNDRHRTVHYRRIADDLRRFVKPGGMVLDYGCGETQAAGHVAEIADQHNSTSVGSSLTQNPAVISQVKPEVFVPTSELR